MNRPNFFCDIDSLDHLAGMDIDGDHKDIPLTMDLIEIPTLLIYTADEENWTLRAVQRGILSVHDGQGTEIGK